MRAINIAFGLIWGFIVSQFLSFLLTLLTFLFLPLPLFLSYWIYVISFILGIVLSSLKTNLNSIKKTLMSQGGDG